MLLRYARWFPLVFLAGFVAVLLAVGYSRSLEGVLLASEAFILALAAFGVGAMIAGAGMWLGLCRSYGGKPQLTPLLDLLLTGGTGLLLVNLFLYPTPFAPALLWAGLGLNGAALLIGLAAMTFNPAYPCHFEMVWPTDGRYWFDPFLQSGQPHHGRRYSMTPDDLTRIEGVGPKIQGILYGAGIINYAGVAQRTPDDLRHILADAHLHAPVDPATWPQQARLAAEGQWDDLDELQDHLRGGRAAA